MGNGNQTNNNTMIAVIVFSAILLFHWIADFVLQTDWQARNKSHNNRALLRHTATYAGVMTLLMWLFLLLPFENAIRFGIITFVVHTIQDYWTSRLNARLWAEKEVHYFFVSIGFDQWLHFVQLFLTFYLL